MKLFQKLALKGFLLVLMSGFSGQLWAIQVAELQPQDPLEGLDFTAEELVVSQREQEARQASALALPRSRFSNLPPLPSSPMGTPILSAPEVPASMSGVIYDELFGGGSAGLPSAPQDYSQDELDPLADFWLTEEEAAKQHQGFGTAPSVSNERSFGFDEPVVVTGSGDDSSLSGSGDANNVVDVDAAVKLAGNDYSELLRMDLSAKQSVLGLDASDGSASSPVSSIRSDFSASSVSARSESISDDRSVASPSVSHVAPDFSGGNVVTLERDLTDHQGKTYDYLVSTSLDDKLV